MDNTKKDALGSAKSQSPREQLKYEIAEELGLLDKINANGWKSLTSKESGRIGGLIAKRGKKAKSAEEERSSLSNENGGDYK